MSCLFLIVSCGDSTETTQDEGSQTTGSTTTGTVTVSGKLIGGENMQMYFDEVFFNSFNPKEKATIDAEGNYKFELSGLDAGIYRLRAGAGSALLVFDGSEKNVVMNGDLATINNLQYEITGSQPSKLYHAIGQQMAQLAQSKQFTEKNVKEMVDTTSNALVASYWAYKAVPLNLTFRYPNPDDAIAVHEAAIQKLTKQYAGTRYVTDYVGDLGQIKAQLATQKIRVGIEAPNISLKNPEGKTYSLHDLKGKVVLLDFWASWCRPCRMNNPEVVRIYNQYKSKGFTVFSVSLDGLDANTKRRFAGNQASIDNYLAQERTKWISAIQQDNLTWDYHVSDLKKWDCEPAKAYGVSGIPKTFLLDKNGKIAAINARGKALENAVKELL